MPLSITSPSALDDSLPQTIIYFAHHKIFWIMNEIVEDSFYRLKKYCEGEAYRGWDPYDGLTSKLFRKLPLIKNNSLARLAWIQFFKRSPVNFRSIVSIPKQYNAKGLGLFLTGYCNLYNASGDQQTLDTIHFLARKIISLQSKGYSGSCWGYYFDWQARAFFQPAYTPTVVATSFVADALWNAFDITGEASYRYIAVSSADFVLQDLNRTYDENGDFSFSYSPLDQTTVFNASLLGARLLARAYQYTRNDHLKQEACRVIRYACNFQGANGEWSYGTLPFHSWVDNFHTGFNLECISDYSRYTGDNSFDNALNKGFRYYINTFFMADGRSKYYNNKLYPVDIHAPAQLMITLAKLQQFEKYGDLADRVLHWTISHMQDKRGFFYYQNKEHFSSRVPYMRWAQAWMFYAMTYYMKYRQKTDIPK